jgi:hypothetical protein
MLMTSLSGLRFGRMFFEIGYFYERNSNIQWFFAKFNSESFISEPEVHHPFFSLELFFAKKAKNSSLLWPMKVL